MDGGIFAETHGEAQHGAHFAGGAARDGEEGGQLRRGAALKAFRDVVRDGERGAAELVPEVPLVAEALRLRELEHGDGQVRRRIPRGKLLESPVGGHGNAYSSDWKFQFENLAPLRV